MPVCTLRPHLIPGWWIRVSDVLYRHISEGCPVCVLRYLMKLSYKSELNQCVTAVVRAILIILLRLTVKAWAVLGSQYSWLYYSVNSQIGWFAHFTEQLCVQHTMCRVVFQQQNCQITITLLLTE